MQMRMAAQEVCACACVTAVQAGELRVWREDYADSALVVRARVLSCCRHLVPQDMC